MINDALSEFDLRSARCFDENDRAFVEENVAKFMKELNIVDLDAEHAVIMDTFNHKVRDELGPMFKIRLGLVGLHYKYMVLFGILERATWVDDFGGMLRAECSMRSLLIAAVHIFLLVPFSIAPNAITIAFWVLSYKPRLTGIENVVMSLSLLLVAGILTHLIIFPGHWWTLWAWNYDLYLMLWVFYAVLNIIVTCLLYVPHLSAAVQHRISKNSSVKEMEKTSCIDTTDEQTSGTLDAEAQMSDQLGSEMSSLSKESSSLSKESI